LKATTPRAGEDKTGLDSHWDRRFQKGAIIPDISIDLHGQGLAGAHARLDHALDQAIQQKLRVILLITGKARAHDRASGGGRGAIAAVVRDWLAASRHATHIAAVRQAHPRHGGDGALYIVLRR
jgi:DNA-nicking Smr family endonuclease